MAAHGLWLLFPGEIASDLSQYHHRRIADWHDGTMNSYELLELCEYMPDAGRFKAALRAWNPQHPWLFMDWSEPQQAMYQTANEVAVLRAGSVQARTEEIPSILFIPPARVREMADKMEATAEGREIVFAMADRRNGDG